MDTLVSIGGTEGALRKLVEQLPGCGFDCAIGSFELNTDAEFIRLFPCPLFDLTIRNVYGPRALRTAWRLRQLMAQHKFDVIHTMFPTADLWGGPIARFASRAVLVSGRRDMGIVRSAKHDFAYRWLGGHFDQVQAVSHAARQACIERDGLAPERVVTVYNGVDLAANQTPALPLDLHSTFGLERSGPTIISLASTIAPVKGIDVLLQAAALVCRQRPDTNFLILGSTDDRYIQRIPALARHNRRLQPMPQALGISANVKFAGWIPGVASALKSSDIFCLPSRSEGLSNALLEAMAAGLPCVATAVGGNPEVVVDHETGYLVPSEDPRALAARLLELLADPALRLRMGNAGERRIRERFSVGTMAQNTANAYRAALEQRGL